MNKKIRFPLEMDQGVEVRNLEELIQNFSLTKVIDYVKDGKLVIWLRDRYANEIADKIEKLEYNDEKLPMKICEIFEIPYDEKILEREKRLEILKQFTTEKRYLDVIDNVSFDQDELYDLLDADEKTIYLCGNKFNIPLEKHGIKYIGINNPIITIDSNKNIDLNMYGIEFEGIESIGYIEKNNENDNSIMENKVIMPIGEYSDKSFLNFIVSSNEKTNSKRIYDMLSKELGSINFDIDNDILTLKKLIYESKLIGLADQYISR